MHAEQSASLYKWAFRQEFHLSLASAVIGLAHRKYCDTRGAWALVQPTLQWWDAC